MLEVGTVFMAQLESIETYGAYLRVDDERIFVDHGNYSWCGGETPIAVVSIGDWVPVRILRYAYPQRIIQAR